MTRSDLQNCQFLIANFANPKCWKSTCPDFSSHRHHQREVFHQTIPTLRYVSFLNFVQSFVFHCLNWSNQLSIVICNYGSWRQNKAQNLNVIRFNHEFNLLSVQSVIFFNNNNKILHKLSHSTFLDQVQRVYRQVVNKSRISAHPLQLALLSQINLGGCFITGLFGITPVTYQKGWNTTFRNEIKCDILNDTKLMVGINCKLLFLKMF